ncbi:hypothetical protein, partial [Paralimibaculum aggregatum]|uniref:hypothetical protein n=1 Tax=Paralimibaculum aggregatum TaxID=3036245 RepID=UPI00255577C6
VETDLVPGLIDLTGDIAAAFGITEAPVFDFTDGIDAAGLADGIVAFDRGGADFGPGPEAWLLDQTVPDAAISAAGFDPLIIGRVSDINANLYWDPGNLELIDITDYDSFTSRSFETANIPAAVLAGLAVTAL